MKIFGLSMEKNIKYEQGKRLLEKTIKQTDIHAEWFKDMCKNYDENLPEYTGFDYHQAIRYMRTWDIIKELPTDKKNLFIIYTACDFNYKNTLAIFNDIGKGYKNAATLRVMISNIRKQIKEIYKDRYGTN